MSSRRKRISLPDKMESPVTSIVRSVWPKGTLMLQWQDRVLGSCICDGALGFTGPSCVGGWEGKMVRLFAGKGFGSCREKLSVMRLPYFGKSTRALEFSSVRCEGYSYFSAVSSKLGDGTSMINPSLKGLAPRKAGRSRIGQLSRSRQGLGLPLRPAPLLRSPVLFPSGVCFRCGRWSRNSQLLFTSDKPCLSGSSLLSCEALR